MPESTSHGTIGIHHPARPGECMPPSGRAHRRLASGDLGEVLGLYAAYRDVSAAHDDVARWLDVYPSVGVWEHGALVAFCYTQRNAPGILEIDNLYVAPSHRSHGIGADMLRLVESAALAEGYQGLFLTNALGLPAREVRRSPETFYVDNGYTVVLRCGPTLAFVKQLSITD